MKFLIVSKELVGGALCTRLLKEGHEVKLFIEKEDCKESLEGIVPKTADWRSELHWVDRDGIIIFDDVGFGEAQDRLRTLGYRVVGGSPESDRMELDRGFFQKRLIDLDIPTLQFKDFDNATDAIEFIRANPKRWVVKQNTHLGALNYIGESTDGLDAIKILESYKTLGYKAHLQERVYGIEVAVGLSLIHI
jgi:phosphoribosylamine--glycine ligase